MPHVPQLQNVLQFFSTRHMKKFHKNIGSQWQIVARIKDKGCGLV